MIVFHHIRIKQFRAYEDVSVNFDANSGVILMHGDNGAGKSSLLNAINWCLYGDTPFFTTTKVTEVLNKHAPVGATTEVEIIASIGQKKHRFYRKTNSDVAHGGTLDVSFEENGNWTVLSGASGRDAVRKILPKDIRHLFFFNGERLKDIFSRNSEHNLEESVYKVAELDVIDNAIAHTKAVELHFLREIKKVSRNSDKIEQLTEAQQTLESALAGHDEVVKEHLETQKDLKRQVAELDKLIKDTALAREYMTRRDLIKNQISNLDEVIFNASEEKRQQIQKNYHKLLLLESTKEYKSALEDASEAGSIPPPISPDVTQKILEDGKCICGSHIGEEQRLYIERQHADYKSKNELRFLTDGILTFASIDEKVSDARYALLDADEALSKANKEKTELQEELRKITVSLQEIDESQVHDNPEARRIKLENKIGNLNMMIGGLGTEKVRLEDQLNQVKKDLQKAASADVSAKGIESKWIAAQRLQEELLSVKKYMENAIRTKLKASVWKTFSSILPDTNYVSIDIDSDYEITLLANDNTQYTPHNISEGQAKVLGLSLAHGLSKDLGYADIPLLIDNLYGNIGETHYEDVTEMVESLATDKQVIIMDLNIDKTASLFKPGSIAQRFHISRSADDNKTIIEEIS